MKEVVLKKYVDFAIVAEFNIAVLKVINPVAAGILNMSRKAFLYYPLVHTAHKSTWQLKIAYVPLEMI